ncbi:MAG: arsenite methyltransferase [Candidatus Bathyarchaeia archaeon]
MSAREVKEHVKKVYGEIAQNQGSCGCGRGGPSSNDTNIRISYSEEDLKNIPEDSTMGLGCGNPVALAGLQEGETVLDLGSGGGIDVFLAAKKVGAKGKVIGVDMTEEMINKSSVLATKCGYPNVEFRLGEIENLPIENESIDIIISNCVINLSPDKEKVFREAHRVLKPNGRLMISDIVTEEELPDEVKKSFAAWAGCVAGALEKNQYLNTIKRAGFKKVEIVSQSTNEIELSEELKGEVTSIQVEAYKN